MQYFKTESWISCRTCIFKLFHFVVIHYEIQLYLVILYFRTFTFRKKLAEKIFRYLELTPVFKDNLITVELNYSNIEILDFFILILISATIRFCQTFFTSILFNPNSLNSINLTPVVVFDFIIKPLKRSIFAFLPLIQLTLNFSRMKRILHFILEVVFNYFFIMALKFERTGTFACRIETTKEYFLNFLRSINYLKFFYYSLRIELYIIRFKLFKLAYYDSAPMSILKYNFEDIDLRKFNKHPIW